MITPNCTVIQEFQTLCIIHSSMHSSVHFFNHSCPLHVYGQVCTISSWKLHWSIVSLSSTVPTQHRACDTLQHHQPRPYIASSNLCDRLQRTPWTVLKSSIWQVGCLLVILRSVSAGPPKDAELAEDPFIVVKWLPTYCTALHVDGMWWFWPLRFRLQ